MARPRNVRISRTAEKALEGLERRILHRLKASVRELAGNPLLGKTLQGDFEDLGSDRLGVSGIVYRFTREAVEIISIDHRKDVYR